MRTLRRTLRLLAAFALLAGFASAVGAHHILGIPHYKYGDDYPQIPYLEVIAQVGSYDLDFTYFPGIPEPGERIRFKLYVHDRESGAVYREPLDVQVVRKRFLRSAVPVTEDFRVHPGTGPEKNDYKFFLTFEQAEAFEIRVRFPNGEQIETIPFPVVIGKTDDRPLIFGALALLGLSVGAVAVVKRRRKSAQLRVRRSAA